MKRILIPLLVAALMCFMFAAAAEGDTLVFDKGVNTVIEGETVQTVLIREGAPAEGELSYTSSDTRIATVDDSGVVTGVKKGAVTITAVVRTEKKTWRASLKVTVVRPVASLAVNTDKLTVFDPEDPILASLLTARENAEENTLPVILVAVKKKVGLAVTVEPKDATNRKTVLESSNPEIFTTAQNTFTGVAPGEAILTVSSESNPEVRTRFRVLVIKPVTKMKVTASEPSVTVGGQVSVTAAAIPEDASLTAVSWSSGDERILTVDANGTVTGVKRGNGRVIASALDGSFIRANITLKVVQLPEGLTLSTDELTVNVGRTAAVKAKIEPANADNKQVIWTSSDESVATVSKDGRIKAVALGDCTITCTSKEVESVSASLTVHVQQPVTKVAFDEKNAIVYVGDSVRLGWTVEPANASNPTLAFTSSGTKVATVDEQGVVTGVGSGTVNINAVTTDGTKRTARISVKVGPHLEGVEMVRNHAYIDVGETATAGAKLIPSNALNDRMSWVSSDENIVTANGETNKKMRLRGINYGTATVTGTTEDGGFTTSIKVTVGDYDKGLSFRSFEFDRDGYFWLSVKNNTDMTITSITAEFACFDATSGDNDPVPINTRYDKSDRRANKVNIVWNGVLNPGETTTKNRWKMVDYKPPRDIYSTRGTITLVSYQIDRDWIKVIRENRRPWKEY